MHLDRRLLGWGAFFVLLGAIPLLVRGGALDRDLLERWPELWPLLPIGWGLSLILRKTPVEWVGGAVSTITLGIMGGGLIVTGFGGMPSIGCGDGPGDSAIETRADGTFGTSGVLNVEFDCGHLELVPADGSAWGLVALADEGRAPTTDIDGDRVRIRAHRDDDVFNIGANGSDWTVTVPRTPSLDLGLTLNAGDGVADLDGATLRSTNFTLNAGSLDVDLSGVAALSSLNGTVNAGSADLRLPAFDGSVNLSLNAGSMTVCLAAGSEFRVHWSGSLGSSNLDGLGLTKIGDDTWTTAGYGSATDAFDMNLSANAGSFSLRLGGACDD